MVGRPKSGINKITKTIYLEKHKLEALDKINPNFSAMIDFLVTDFLKKNNNWDNNSLRELNYSFQLKNELETLGNELERINMEIEFKNKLFNEIKQKLLSKGILKTNGSDSIDPER
uniref:Uncharacterized protein n=1 Tax=viral metagenome TaxID=1070528 RepID=A0A6H1ZZ02_9ZZZZ